MSFLFFILLGLTVSIYLLSTEYTYKVLLSARDYKSDFIEDNLSERHFGLHFV